jgi:hypothetical protein
MKDYCSKMFKMFLLAVASTLLLTLSGCSGGGGGDGAAAIGFGGGGAKGPFKEGSLVVAYKLDSNGSRSDTNATTLTTNSIGHFNFGSSISWTGPTEVIISGEYLNENTGTYMVLPADKAISAIINIVAGYNNVNINIFTDIAAAGIEEALANSVPFSQAETDAENSVKKLFNLELAGNIGLTDLDLTDGTTNVEDNTQLLLISSALLNTDNPEQVMDQLAADMADGVIDDSALAALDELKEKATLVDIKQIAINMEEADIGVTNAPDAESVLNGVLSWDHNISFSTTLDAFRATSYTSNEATVVGIYGETGVISIVNGSYSIDGGAFVTAAGNISNGQKVVVKATSSTDFSTNVQISLIIGRAIIPYNIITMADPFVTDTTPNAFSFGFKKDQALGATNVESNPVTITGINTVANISIAGGEFSINGAPYTNVATTVDNEDNVTVRHDASATAGTQVDSIVTIGGVDGKFSTFTIPEDKTPDVFTFVGVHDINKSTLSTSNTITISGINTATPISVVDGNYSIDGGAFTDVAGTISNGQTLAVRLTSSTNFDTLNKVSVIVGNVVSTFMVKTVSDPFVADTTPNEFKFNSKINQAVGVDVDSNAIVVSGINQDTTISIVNGQYSIDGGGFTDVDGNISNDQNVTLRQTTSISFDTETLTTLTIGGISSVFKTITLLEDKIPDDFSFDSNLSITANTLATSNTITISGINTDVNISVVNGEYEINGGGYTSVAGTLSDGDTVTLQQTSSSVQGESNVTTVTIGSSVRSFTTKTVVNAPVISGTPSTTVAEDALYTFIPDVNATSGEINSWSIVNKPTWAVFNTVNGTLSGTPLNADVGITNDINISAINNQGSTSLALFDINVTNTNDAPTAADTSITTDEDTTVDVNVTALISDVDVGDTAAITFTDPSNGSVVNNSGIFTYTPSANYFGADSFTYTVTDSASATATGTVSVTVNSVADATVWNTPATLSAVDEDFTEFTVALDATDADGAVTYDLNSTTSGVTASVTGSTLTVTPVANANGSETITVSATQGGVTVNLSITLTVNAVDDTTVWNTPATLSAVDEDFTEFTVDLNATDVDGAVAYALVSTTGVVTANVTGSTLTVTPIANANGSETITVSATQGGFTVNLPITLTVNAVDDVTVWNTPATLSAVDEDFTEFTVDLNATDVDGTVTYAYVSTTGVVTASVTGSTLTVTPVANANGSVTIVVSATQGGVTLDHSIDLNVTSVNDAPTMLDQNISVDGNSTVSGQIVNSDIDGDTVTVTSAAVSGFTLTDTAGAFTFDATSYMNLPVGSTETVLVTLTANDGFLDTNATLTITVNGTYSTTPPTTAFVDGTTYCFDKEDGLPSYETHTLNSGLLSWTNYELNVTTGIFDDVGVDYARVFLIDGVWDPETSEEAYTIDADGIMTITDTGEVLKIVHTVDLNNPATEDATLVTSINDAIPSTQNVAFSVGAEAYSLAFRYLTDSYELYWKPTIYDENGTDTGVGFADIIEYMDSGQPAASYLISPDVWGSVNFVRDSNGSVIDSTSAIVTALSVDMNGSLVLDDTNTTNVGTWRVIELPGSTDLAIETTALSGYEQYFEGEHALLAVYSGWVHKGEHYIASTEFTTDGDGVNDLDFNQIAFDDIMAEVATASASTTSLLGGQTVYGTIDDNISNSLESSEFSIDMTTVAWTELIGGSETGTDNIFVYGNIILEVEGANVLDSLKILSSNTEYVLFEELDDVNGLEDRAYYDYDAAVAYYISSAFTYEMLAGQTVYAVMEDKSSHSVFTYAALGTNTRTVTINDFNQTNLITQNFNIVDGIQYVSDDANNSLYSVTLVEPYVDNKYNKVSIDNLVDAPYLSRIYFNQADAETFLYTTVTMEIDKVTITGNASSGNMLWQEYEDDGSDTYTTLVIGSDENESYVVEANSTITMAEGNFSAKYLGTVAYDTFNSDNNTTFTSSVIIYKVAYIMNVEEIDHWGDAVLNWDTNATFTTLEDMILFHSDTNSSFSDNGLGFESGYNSTDTNGTLVLRDTSGIVTNSNAGTWEIVTMADGNRAIKTTPTYDGYAEVWHRAFIEESGVIYWADWAPVNSGGIDYFINQAGMNEFVTFFNANKDSIVNQLFGTEMADFRAAFDSETALDPTPFIDEGTLYIPWIDIQTVQ